MLTSTVGPAAPDAVVLAVNNFGDTRSGGLAGPLGLVFILALGIATVLLIRNMNRRIKRLPSSFDDSNFRAPTSDDKSAPGQPKPMESTADGGPDQAGPDETLPTDQRPNDK